MTRPRSQVAALTLVQRSSAWLLRQRLESSPPTAGSEELRTAFDGATSAPRAPSQNVVVVITVVAIESLSPFLWLSSSSFIPVVVIIVVVVIIPVVVIIVVIVIIPVVVSIVVIVITLNRTTRKIMV